MTIFSFFVPGPPQGKARARAKPNRVFYTPRKTQAYEVLIRTCFLQKYRHWPQLPACVPVGVCVDAMFAPPKRDQRKGPALKKPDVDNVAKVVLDALNRVVWTDDAQVHSLSINKQYGSAVSGQPGLVVRIYCNLEEMIHE